MKLELFKAEDFSRDEFRRLNEYGRADLINQKLNEYIESLPLVLGCEDKLFWSVKEMQGDVLQARLICIEPIEKKECEHYAHNAEFINKGDSYFKCLGCGKKLKAKWETDE